KNLKAQIRERAGHQAYENRHCHRPLRRAPAWQASMSRNIKEENGCEWRTHSSRLVDALERNSWRIFDCRISRDTDAARLVGSFISTKRAACGSPDRERTRRPDHRDALVRLFRLKHSARQFALVARHQFRRRDFV